MAENWRRWEGGFASEEFPLANDNDGSPTNPELVSFFFSVSFVSGF